MPEMHRGNSPESILGRPAGQKDAITGPLYEIVFKRQPQFAHVSITPGISYTLLKTGILQNVDLRKFLQILKVIILSIEVWKRDLLQG